MQCRSASPVAEAIFTWTKNFVFDSNSSSLVSFDRIHLGRHLHGGRSMHCFLANRTIAQRLSLQSTDVWNLILSERVWLIVMAFLIQSRRRLLPSSSFASSLYSCTFEHIKSGVHGDRKGGGSTFEQQVHRNYSFGKRRYSGTSDVIGNAGLEKADVAIIGGGIVGLATAREIVSRYPRATVVVLEKEKQLVPHQTSHNSGVIHAGIYYEPGSAMAKLCVEGAQRMYEYCEKKQLPHKRVGKLIVATQEHELKTLEDLYHRAVANKVQGLELLSPKQIQDMEPNIRALRALHSPNTGITDYAAVGRSFAEDIIASGRGQIRTRFEVNAIDADANKGVNLQSKSGDVVKAKWLVTCAGLQADYVAQMAGGGKGPTVLPFRGTYHELKPELCNIITRNIYPVPDPRFPMVGVHLTPRVDGRVLVGPNAALSLSKEGYKFWNFNLKDFFLFARNKGLWKLVLGNPVIVLQEVWRDINKGAFIKEANRYCPSLRVDHTKKGWAGVHAVAVDDSGKVVGDFIFENGKSGIVLNVRNAPSPACTSSLAIATAIVDRASRDFDWKGL